MTEHTNDNDTQRSRYVPRLERDGERPLVVAEGGADGRLYEYFVEPGLLSAANAALVLRRPLLLTGEAGCGKTHFAHAAARWFFDHWSDRALSSLKPRRLEPGTCIVRSDAKAKDLLYHFDALARFGDAQLDAEACLWARNPRNYITLEPLGEALTQSWFSVVLVDEIDKSPRDLPNDLLDVLTERRFQIRELRRNESQAYCEHYLTMPIDPDGQRLEHWMNAGSEPDAPVQQVWPFIVITSNTERQLPAAFLRRCVSYHIRPFERSRLLQIVANRFPSLYGNGDRTIQGNRGVEDAQSAYSHGEALVDLFLHVRRKHMEKSPSTAELLDALAVVEHELGLAEVAGVSAGEKGGLGWPCRLGRFARELARGYAHASREAGLEWRDLPFFGCLVKLESDIEKISV